LLTPFSCNIECIVSSFLDSTSHLILTIVRKFDCIQWVRGQCCCCCSIGASGSLPLSFYLEWIFFLWLETFIQKSNSFKNLHSRWWSNSQTVSSLTMKSFISSFYLPTLVSNRFSTSLQSFICLHLNAYSFGSRDG
jgi:hypothetical protein